MIFQETEHCEPAAGAEKIRFSTVSVVVCIPESQKKRLRRYKKVLEKLHYIELLWLHFRIEIWQPPLPRIGRTYFLVRAPLQETILVPLIFLQNVRCSISAVSGGIKKYFF